MNNHLYWIWLRLALKGNVKMMYALYQVAGSIDAVFHADKNEYLDWGVPEQYLGKLTDKNVSKAYSILGLCEKFDIGILSIEDDGYPKLLREIALPPCLLFYNGHLSECLVSPSITVIGTRHSTVSGEATASEMARHLSLSGFTIVCGVAQGIEAVVQDAVVQTDGRALLVLPCGLLSVSKRVSHIIRNILPHGAVISELLPHEKTMQNAYHIRNRILSGLSLGTLVLQAPKRSGALMTAGYALEQGRDVFVLPGGVRDPSFAGNNELLREGAQPVIDFSDIVRYYKPRFGEQLTEVFEEDLSFENYMSSISESSGPEFKNDKQSKIYGVLTDRPQFMEDIAGKSGLSISEVMSELTLMEMYGWVEATPGGAYKIIS